MATRGAVRRFNDFAARPPARWQRAMAVFLAVFLPYSAWQERGAVGALITIAVFAPILLLGTFRHERVGAWSARHPGLDAALLIPIVFACMAGVTDLSLAVCALVGLAAGAILAPVSLRRRARR